MKNADISYCWKMSKEHNLGDTKKQKTLTFQEAADSFHSENYKNREGGRDLLQDKE